MPMKCPEPTMLIDVVYDECATEDHGRVLAHLEECRECRKQWAELRAVLVAADRWAIPSASPGIAERALARVASERARSSPADRPPILLQHPLGLLLLGAAAASLSLVLVSTGVHEEAASPLMIGLVGVLWTVLYGSVGRLTLHRKYHHVALAAMLGSGISLIVTPVLSMPAVIEASRRWIEAAEASSLLNVTVLLTGVLYASTPAFASSLTVTRASRFTRASRSAVLSDATWLAGIYALLVAPSVCLQCQHLALSLTVAWVAGMLLGAFLGSLSGVSLGTRLRPMTA